MPNDCETYTPDAGGYITSIRQRDGVTLGFTFDNLGHQFTRSENGTQMRSYGYDLLGHMISATPTSGTAETMAYDALGRLTQRGQAYTTLAYQYDAKFRGHCVIDVVIHLVGTESQARSKQGDDR